MGTVTLNATTYGDMALRGRPSSNVPAEVAGKLAGKLGIELSDENRKSGLGALQGYVVGLGVGAAYGVVRPLLGRDVSTLAAGVGLGLVAMAGSDVPSAALGVTDPTSWGTNAWVSDLVPHLAYGIATAASYEALAG